MTELCFRIDDLRRGLRNPYGLAAWDERLELSLGSLKAEARPSCFNHARSAR